MCPQHKSSGSAEAHWHTAGGSSPHRPFDSRPGKKFKSPRPKAHPGTEGSQAWRSSILPKTPPAQGPAVGMTTLGTETSLPCLCSGTPLYLALSRSRMSKQTNKWPLSGSCTQVSFPAHSARHRVGHFTRKV